MALTKEEIEKIEEEERIRAEAKLRYSQRNQVEHKNGIPTLLSFFIPGLGQIVKGEVVKGVLIFIFFIIGCFCLVFPGLIIWIWQLVDAYNVNSIKENKIKKIEGSSNINNFNNSLKKSHTNNDQAYKNSLLKNAALWLLALLCDFFAIIFIIYFWYIAIPLILLYIFRKRIIIDNKSKLKIKINNEGLGDEIYNFLKVKNSPNFYQMFIFGLMAFLAVLIICLAVIYWYYSIPAILILLVWIKTDWSNKNKIISTCFLGIIIISIPFYFNYLNRPTVISNLSPEDGFSIQSERIVIKGKVDPVNAIIKINDAPIPVNNGLFEYEVALPKEENSFTISAINKGIKSTTTSKILNIKRILTEEEKEAMKQAEEEARIKAEADAKAAEDARIKEKAEADAIDRAIQAELDKKEKAWLSSPAGIICTKHPEWTEKDCERVAGKKIWIGMAYDMLVYEFGKPDSKNLSNYGSGSQWQYCWWDVTPTNCFYDNNNDGIIDSYN